MIKNPLTKFLTGFAAQMTRCFVPNQPAPAAEAAQAKPKPVDDFAPLVVSHDYDIAKRGLQRVASAAAHPANQARSTELGESAELALFRMNRADPQKMRREAATLVASASPEFAGLLLDRARAAFERLEGQKIDLLKQPLLQPELLAACASRLGAGLEQHKAHGLLTVVTTRLKRQDQARVMGLAEFVKAGSSTAKLLGNLVARPFNALARVAQQESPASPLSVNPDVSSAWRDVVTDLGHGLNRPSLGLTRIRVAEHRRQNRLIAAQLREEMQNGDTVPMPLEPSRRAVGAPPAHVPVVLREELPAAVLRRGQVLART